MVSHGNNQSIDRAFALMGVAAAGPVRLTDLADRTGLAMSTTSRLANALVAVGAFEHVDSTYRLGPAIAALSTGATSQRDLLRLAALSVLQVIVDETGETAALAVSEGDDILYVVQVSGPATVEVGDWTDHRHAAHGSAFGLALMSDWAPSQVRRYLLQPLTAFTPATVTDPTLIRERLDTASSDGHVWAVDEFAEDVTGIASPVTGPQGGVVASIGVFAPSYRFPGSRDRREIEEIVGRSAVELSWILGATSGVS
ncbi:MAG: IclR family transcriptional regulator [Actinomycetia bacterium]|nr:IclR family transcriptional regulator [Actinomycetes bacterium]